MKVYSRRISFILESQGRLPRGSDTTGRMEAFSRRGNDPGWGLEVRRSWISCRVPQGNAVGI